MEEGPFMRETDFPKIESASLKHPTALNLSLPDPLPDDIQELFGKCQSKLGLIPNVLIAFAHRPDKLRAFSQMYNELMLGESGVSKLEREMIAVTVSSINSCWYCLPTPVPHHLHCLLKHLSSLQQLHCAGARKLESA